MEETVKVSLEADTACEASLTITTSITFTDHSNVVMGSVTFTPHYPLRASSLGTESTLNIRYHARISNTSGEDWNDVSLAISTAQASETTVIPRMMRWTVDFQATYNNYVKQKKSMGMANVMNRAPMQQAIYPSAYGSNLESGPGASIDAYDPTIEMGIAAAEVSEGITSTFIIP